MSHLQVRHIKMMCRMNGMNRIGAVSSYRFLCTIPDMNALASNVVEAMSVASILSRW
jgi:hypothetical protein